MEEGIYYRRGSKSDFASVDMLPGGQDIPRIVIEKITFHEKITINGRKETDVFTAKFAKNPWCDKEMVLNSTNKTRIAKRFWNTPVEDGTPCEGRINLLKNIPVRLTKEEARDVQNGGTTYGLRISRIEACSVEDMQKWLSENGYGPAEAPKKKVVPEDKVESVIAWAKKNGYSFAQVADMYDFENDAVRDTIEGALNDLPAE